MKLTLNKEFARRHLFVAVLMAGMGCWFGYDGFVRYPATDAAVLYRKIEGENSVPPPTLDLEAFKRQKTQTQYGFTFLCFLAAALVGGHLWKVSKFELEFDDEGFAYEGKRHLFAEVKDVDRSLWQKKGIIVVDGVKLDAWHHAGVKELEEKLRGMRDEVRGMRDEG